MTAIALEASIGLPPPSPSTKSHSSRLAKAAPSMTCSLVGLAWTLS